MALQNEQFLTILRGALTGQAPVFPAPLTETDWDAVMKCSAEHKLLPLMADAVHTLPGGPEVLARYRSAIRQQVMVQALKTDEFLQLYRFLDRAGIRPLVVKGILLRSLYPKPDLRPSADEDLVVKPEAFAAARQALEDFGMVCVSPNQNQQELAFRKQGSPLYIELHSALFPDGGEVYSRWNDLFRDVADRAEPVEVLGTPLLAPEPADHLLYLIGHALKHFLHSGFGIRQICDIGMFVQIYGHQICWNRVVSGCGQLQATAFTAAIFRIAQRHLGFRLEEAGIPPVLLRQIDEVPMLEDLLTGGVYGTVSKARVRSATVTLAAASAHREGKQAKASLLPALFPPATQLEGRFPWLKDRHWLLPAAWAVRMAAYGKELRSRPDTDPGESTRIGSQRVELLRYYGIIGKQ